MTAFRRARSNFALQRARDWARSVQRPLVVLEAVRTRYRWASDRMHRFVIEGMRDNAIDFSDTPVLYYPYVEPRAGRGHGLVETLAKDACLVVTDDYPCFFHPHMIQAVSKSLPARLELIDSNCLMPLAAMDRTFTVAHSYRRAMQKILPTFLEESPQANPLQQRHIEGMVSLKRLPEKITQRWPAADLEALLKADGLKKIDIDHDVLPTSIEGGSHSARKRLRNFVQHQLGEYNEQRNHPDAHGSSALSPHLHFGHLSAHEFFWALMEACQWNPTKLHKPNGSVQGFWNVNESCEAILDQLCTWREIGFNMCWREPNYDRYESLPDWAIASLEKHTRDQRPHLYSLEELEQGKTYDTLWNAAQHQLVREGRIHNYLRMVWGKRFLEWTKTPQQALEYMIELNNKYALDGRDPNSYSGIFWVLGRYDRAWGPERPIFGKIRYMSSDNTARKVQLKNYVKQFAN